MSWSPLPQIPMPPNGFPTVVFSRTGPAATGPSSSRGQPAPNEPPSRPARDRRSNSARWGLPDQHRWAAWRTSQPRGTCPARSQLPCLRRSQPGRLSHLNISNPAPSATTSRGAAELVLTAHILDGLSVDASACPTLANANVKFDVTKLGLMGHSMGATISPLSSAFEPRFGRDHHEWMRR